MNIPNEEIEWVIEGLSKIARSYQNNSLPSSMMERSVRQALKDILPDDGVISSVSALYRFKDAYRAYFTARNKRGIRNDFGVSLPHLNERKKINVIKLDDSYDQYDLEKTMMEAAESLGGE